MSEDAYEAQCELTTERELAKLRSHVQMRGMPSTLSAHAQDRTKTFAEGLSGFRRMDALRWRLRSRRRPAWPASAAQAADWPRLAEARGSLKQDLTLIEAPREPDG